MSQIIESSLPMVIQKQEQETAINYRIYGSAEGLGEETENLFDGKLEQGSFNSSTGQESTSAARIRSDYIHIQTSDNYTITLTGAEGVVVYVYDANKNFLSAESNTGWGAIPFTREFEANRYVRFAFAKSSSGTYEGIVPSDVSNIMLVPGSTVPASYIPYGYQIPLTVGSGETENSFPFPVAGTYALGSSAAIVSDGSGKLTLNGTVTRDLASEIIPLVAPVTFPLSEDYTFYLGNLTSARNMRIAFYGENDDYLGFYSFDGRWRKISTMPDLPAVYGIGITTNSAASYTATDFIVTPMLSKNPDLTEYIPYRYTADYPIYIGSSKLGAEEYVDYESGKVYRCYGELTLKGDEENLYYYGSFVGVQTFYLNLPDNDVFVAGTPYLSCNYYSTVYESRPAVNKTCRYRWYDDSQKWGLERIYMFDNDYTSLSAFKAHLAELYNNGVPLKISYLLKDAPVPTDPPAPLPSITSYIGENTFNSTEVINKMRIEFNEGFIYEGKDISQFHINNQFYDLVDSSFYSLIADDFNSLTFYSEGDYCIYNYQLYKCLFATQGDWISECWELISLADLIQGDGQEVGVDDDTWRIIYEICNGTLSDNLVIDYDYIKGGKFAYCDMSTAELPNCSQISPYTFYSCKNLSFISASNCTSIGYCAFSACDALVSYNMPLVQTIDTEAFRACITLSLASFSQNLQIGSRAFLDCTSLSEVNMPAVSIIYSDAFSGCTALTTLELPGCLSIYSYALRSCTKLETASFPNLVRIYSSGFTGCAKLMSLYLLSTKMCTLQNANAFGGTPISVSTGGVYGSIYVPSTLVESYKVATQWATYSNRFVAYQE